MDLSIVVPVWNGTARIAATPAALNGERCANVALCAHPGATFAHDPTGRTHPPDPATRES